MHGIQVSSVVLVEHVDQFGCTLDSDSSYCFFCIEERVEADLSHNPNPNPIT
jgi:hypothetical protein